MINIGQKLGNELGFYVRQSLINNTSNLYNKQKLDNINNNAIVKLSERWGYKAEFHLSFIFFNFSIYWKDASEGCNRWKSC